ncbi:MAG TPA: hypothetical protein V6C82_06545 [Chroococcales cyanobacterium]
MGFDFNFDPFQVSYEQPYQPAPKVTSGPILGVLLVESRVLTQEQLDEALAAQKTKACPLVQALIEGGFCTNDQINTALTVRPNYS